MQVKIFKDKISTLLDDAQIFIASSVLGNSKVEAINIADVITNSSIGVTLIIPLT